MISRRRFFTSILAGSGAFAATARFSFGQDPSTSPLADTSNLFAMDQGAARTVRRPPKPGAKASMTTEERDALEHRIRCQCGCTLDVYTCRTTDFTCQVSPQMHRDVLALVDGGYTSSEILEAFVDSYGERVLMAPPKQGFNLLAYVMPGAAIAAGAVVLAVIVRRWRKPRPIPRVPVAAPIPGTPAEVAELEAAIRDDS